MDSGCHDLGDDGMRRGSRLKRLDWRRLRSASLMVVVALEEHAHTRVLPLDFDRHPESDTGYSGWVQFDDGEIYIVNYILDDAPKAQIRGISLRMDDFLIS